MKEEKFQFGQYSNENHTYDDVNNEEYESFLQQTAPLIGYIVHDFNKLDESLNNAIWQKISDRTDEIGALITYKMNFSAKVDLFKRIIKAMEIGCDVKILILNELIEKLKRCATLRNAVVHAEWYNMNEKDYTFVKLNFEENGLKQHYWQFTPESLGKIIDLINETYFLFDTYYEQKDNLLSR